MSEIDFVITWVDPSDTHWYSEKQKYSYEYKLDMNSEARYRDWGILKYWFRSVEKNAPWVNKVYFITEGHVPKWLNIDYEKIIVVKHADYIPEKFLPTFNSNTIELNLNRIETLSNSFVNFNDDMFINSPVEPKDFFENGLPKDSGVFSPIVPKRGSISSIALNNIEIINEYFNSRFVIKKNFFKFFNLKYGKHLVKNLCILPWRNVLGFYDNHIPISYDKKFYNMLWAKESKTFENTTLNKFRTKEDVSHWVIRYWQLCEGHFIPRSTKFGKYYDIFKDIDKICDDIKNNSHKVICINDGDGVINFNDLKNRLLEVFEMKYDEKSKFER
uniref:Capsular polysaccharide phosphotransferase n=1 Tax=Lactococcus lactis TaxID=1358 RepID=A0A451F0B3_9LACT|nr:capsular polysaccharide phosphotransferase [Lactococcus lactis]